VQRDEIRKYYEDPRNQPSDSGLGHQWAYLQRFLPKAKHCKILDAGCGAGRYALALAGQGYSGIDAIDLFDRLETSGAFRYKCSSIDHIEFPDDAFDFVYSMSVLYHLENPKNGLSEIWRVLKPAGILVLSAHTRYSLFTLSRVIRAKAGLAEHLKGVKFRSASAYCRFLYDVGFRILDVDGFRLIPVQILEHFVRYHPGEQEDMRYERHFSEASPCMKRIRSVAGYHFLIAAEKLRGTRQGIFSPG